MLATYSYQCTTEGFNVSMRLVLADGCLECCQTLQGRPHLTQHPESSAPLLMQLLEALWGSASLSEEASFYKTI
jgi:hypothetical protein